MVPICWGQNFVLKYTGSAETLQIIQKFQPLEHELKDSLTAVRKLNVLFETLYASGYLTARVDKRVVEDSTLLIQLSTGLQYQWAHLKPGNLPEIIQSKTGYRERFYTNEAFNYKELTKFFKKITNESENTGYPFASVKMDSILIEGISIKAVLDFSRGPLITYDSLVVTGTDKVKPKWLSGYLDISYGATFNQKVIDEIASKLQNLNFIELDGPVQIAFQNSEATINLNLKYIEANRIDGVIGFLPNAQDGDKLIVTGQFDLSLSNLFGSGKSIYAEWQRLRPLTQILNIGYNHTNLLGSPLHLDLSYHLLKEDTLFINRNANFTIDYERSFNEISFFTRFKTSRLLSTSQYVDKMKLPEINDFNLSYYGMGYSFTSFNMGNTLRSGIGFDIEGAVGTKKIRRNSALPSEIYDDLELNSVQYQIEGAVKYYVPMSKRVIFYQQIKGGKVINDNLFLNDLFRLGGLNTLRGFNENFYFASEYMLSNIELQFHYDTNSYMFIFYDQSYLYFNVGGSKQDGYPLGIGVGINFSTRSGILSLAYALGRSEEQPLSLRLSKFHFGYIAKF